MTRTKIKDRSKYHKIKDGQIMESKPVVITNICRIERVEDTRDMVVLYYKENEHLGDNLIDRSGMLNDLIGPKGGKPTHSICEQRVTEMGRDERFKKLRKLNYDWTAKKLLTLDDDYLTPDFAIIDCTKEAFLQHSGMVEM